MGFIVFSSAGGSVSGGIHGFVGGEAVAPEVPGEIVAIEVGAEQWCLNTGTFLACDQEVAYEMVRQDVKGALFGGTGGLYVMKTKGQGTLLVSAFGELEKIQLDGSQPVIIDNQHVVAWTNRLSYDIKAASGAVGFKTGEGLVNRFEGVGEVYIQTRNLENFTKRIREFLPTEQK
ncbi:MAG: AIM24 family protein [Enterococcus sp.]